MEITIDDRTYELDVELAKRNGCIKLKIPLEIGDVYTDPQGCVNNLLLVKTSYDGSFRYQLLGMGLAPNSDDFYKSPHTLNQIKRHLELKKMVFSHNIENQVIKLVQSP